MKRHLDQGYLDLGSSTGAPTEETVDPGQLPGQTTFDLGRPERIISLIGDGTAYTLHD